MKKALLLLTLLASTGLAAWGQAKSTASRLGDLQVGGGYTNANSDYLPARIRGYTLYGTFDVTAHLGGEFDFHQLNSNSDGEQVYERSYEFGARYFRNYGRFKPYIRGAYGRGVFNFPFNEANLAYNMFVGAGGVDIAVRPRINVRGEFEYQHWLSFPPDGLTPTMFTIGAAYHFPAGRPR